MEEFEFKGPNGSMTITMIEVFGFPTKPIANIGFEWKVGIKVNIGSYSVDGIFYTSTREWSQFYKKLEKSQANLTGNSEFESLEDVLQLTVSYNLGKVNISGRYQENHGIDNILEFEFNTDQSYMRKTIEQLEVIIEKYN